MPTVDRKNDTDEKHSLSSFDKRKVQSVTFGARHFDRKKYKVVNHGTVSPRNVPNQNVRCQVDNESCAPLEHEEKVDRNISFKNNFAKPDSYNYTHQRNAVNNADTGTSDISPEMAQRMKRAAFLAQQNNEAISINTATVIPTDDFHNTEMVEKLEEKPEIIAEKSDEKEEQSFESRFTGKSEHADFNRYDNARHEYAVNQANARYQSEQRYKQQSRENESHRDVLDEISSAATITGQLGRGEVGKAAADIIVKNAFPENGLRDTAQTIGNAVSGSSSVSSAIPDVATTLAAVEAKKLVAKIMKGESSEKDRQFVEEHKAAGKTKYVDSHKDGFKVEHRISEDEHIVENMSREERRNFLHNKRVAEKQKNFYADRIKTERKNKQKEMFLDFNKDNPELVSNTAKGTGKRYAKKKAAKALIGGGVLASIIPIIVVIIVFAVIAAFFGWLVPYSYSLAGEDGDEIEAATNAEVIDGYAKLIKNYMDVTQAYYYLNYGDWYGGTYNYPSPDISFPEFFSEYCQSIVSEIQSYYYDLIAAAPNVNQKNALIDAMNNAISTAISNAMPATLAEYNALMASLDDSLTAETHRQHYETEQQSVPNNNADSAEFTGMPVVGTNHFGNVEINSDLSAEELLAYIALYKSMSIINPDDSDSNAEQILNITPQDIMDFFEETEYITITTEVTHGNFCSGMNCKRRLVDEAWEYYCDGDHDNLSGEIGACKTADELREKVMELTDAESNGVDEDSFNKLIEEYMKLIKKELDITEADYRKFGAADNTKAQEFYSILIGDEEIPNNFWNIETPIG